jgi:cell division protein FtsQ
VSRKPRQPLPARTTAAVLRAPQRFAVVLPSARSIVVGLVVAACCALAYLGARDTSVFAVREIVVTGVSPRAAVDVRRALLPLEGESLVALRPDDVDRLAEALPQVESVTYDRAFPHTLHVVVEPERPLAVLRIGADSWLVSRTARVIAQLPRGARPTLPRIWKPASAGVAVGGTLAAGDGAAEIKALAPVRSAGFGGRVATVKIEGTQVTYLLRGGLEVRAGDASDLPLKLTIARRILAQTPVRGYLDVSVPERPVGVNNSQVSG